MAGSSNGTRKVRFEEPRGEKPEKEGFGSRLRKIFGRERRADTLEEAVQQARAAPQEFEPFVICAPEIASGAREPAPKQEEAGFSAEVEKFLASLPNADIGKNARETVRQAAMKAGRALSVDEAKEAVVRDENAGAEEMIKRRLDLIQLAFKSKQEFFEGRKVVQYRETVNVFYFCMSHFIRMIGAMGVRPDAHESDLVRAKGGDREEVLVKIEKTVNLFGWKDRLDAFRLIADMGEKMRETLCSKEVCDRIGKYCENLEDVKGDRLEALRDLADFVKKNGVKPSGRNMQSDVPRVEEMKIREWLQGRPEGIRKAAEAVVAKEKPGSLEGLMRMLETVKVDPGEEMEKKLFVGEQVLGRWTNIRQEFRVLEDTVARNVAYYCVNDLLRVSSLADGLENAEQMKSEAVEAVLAIAKRMPEGRRMEAPAIIAELVGLLKDDKKPKQWILGVWLVELRAYTMEPDKERAYNKLRRLRVIANPMEIV